MGDFLTRRDDLRQTRVAASGPPGIDEGQALLRVSRIGLTANNITYGLLGDAMNYWRFFEAPHGWGRVPVWGFADVAASEAEGLEAGGRVYGYLPPSEHLVVDVADAGEVGFRNAAPHLDELPSAYHRYLHTGSDPFYDERHEDQQALLRPLFFTSFLLDDELGEGGLSGARVVAISSASSKTAIAAAFMLAQRQGVDVVGLTSSRNLEFVKGLEIYDEVVAYDDLEDWDPGRAAFVDIAGDGGLRGRVHRSAGDRLAASITVGASHWEEVGAEPGEMPGPTPRFFFAPDRVTKRAADWGGNGLSRRVADAWDPFVEWVADWLEIDHREGLAGLRDAYLEVLEGRVPPARAHVIDL